MSLRYLENTAEAQKKKKAATIGGNHLMSFLEIVTRFVKQWLRILLNTLQPWTS